MKHPKNSNLLTPHREELEFIRRLFAEVKGLQNCKDPNDQRKIIAALMSGIKARTKSEGSTPKFRRLLSQQFLDAYTVGESSTSVHFGINQNAAVIDLLNDAQVVSLICRGVVAVYPPRLAAWNKQAEFTKKQSRDLALHIIPLVTNSELKTRPEQGAFLRGLSQKSQHTGYIQATAPELAGAHAANFVRTGKDLFDGNIIRVKGTKLYYGDGGLSEMDENDYVNNCRYKIVKTAAKVIER